MAMLLRRISVTIFSIMYVGAVASAGLSISEPSYVEFTRDGAQAEFEHPYHRDLVQASKIRKLNLAGWWSQCVPPDPNLDPYKRCTGNFTPVQPLPLDPTGKTCYINPLTDYNAIQWLAGIPDGNGTLSDEIYLYNIVPNLLTYRNYKPLDCTTGACSCDSIATIREGWDSPNASIPSWCKPNVICTIVPFIPDPNNCTFWGGIRYMDGSLGHNVSVDICYLLADIQAQPRVPKRATSSAPLHPTIWSAVLSVAIGTAALLWHVIM